MNAQKVPTSLGGGRLGYLTLVLKPATYATIRNAVPFIRPLHPGPFNPTDRTQIEIIQQKAVHDELLRVNNEANRVEDTLRT